MDHFAGLDVSVKETSVCIVDDTGKIVREVKVASEPEALLALLKGSDSHSMNFAGDFAVLQMGDQRHADWISNFVPCAEWVGGRERKWFIRLDFFRRPFRSIDGRMPVMRGGVAPNS